MKKWKGDKVDSILLENTKMKIVNTCKTTGKEIGLVSGEYVASRIFYKDIFNQIRNFFGWELKSYSEMLSDAKDNAIIRMIKDAESIGANEIINVKFAISVLTNDSMVVLVSGTGVRK
jgi:uncharacterized protein YbjQ (UPF0145 family)